MTVAEEELVARSAERKVSRSRTPLLIVVGLVALGLASWWALTRSPAVLLIAETPVRPGAVGGSPHCTPRVPATDVDDVFGGGGTILDYRDGARCTVSLSLENTTRIPLTVLAIEMTDPDYIEPLRIVSASRDPKSLYADQECYGCPEDYLPFTPMTLAPGDDWEIAVHGVMSDCTPPVSNENFSQRSRRTLDLTVRGMGVTKIVTMQLRDAWAVRVESCGRVD